MSHDASGFLCAAGEEMGIPLERIEKGKCFKNNGGAFLTFYSRIVARHSKWANIKHRKSAVDAKKGKIFTRLAKLITVAAQRGGDPEMNAVLRMAIQKARAANVPADNIERALKKGTGELKDGQRMEEMTYEGFGPGGAALYIHCLTDNTNRSFANLRNIMTKNGGSLGSSGSVAWMFRRVGVVEVRVPATENQEDLELRLIDAGADDVEWEDGGVRVFCSPDSFERVLKVFNTFDVQKSEITFIPQERRVLEDYDSAQALLKLIDALETDDDVDEVFTNAEFSDVLLKTLSDEGKM